MLDKLFSRWAWFHRLRFPLGAAFAWVVATLGLIGGAVGLLDSFKANTTVREWVLSLTLAGITIAALLTLAIRELQLNRQSKFVSVLSHLERASDQLRDLRIFLNIKREMGSVTKEDLSRARIMIEDVLSTYADAFSILTSTRCRTCVKLIHVADETPDEVLVFALARDRYSAVENKVHDKKRSEFKLDRLVDNTDYLRLWDPTVEDGGFYLSDDLKKEKDYETSSAFYWRNIAGNPNTAVENNWLLPYRSTIVWPIRREVREELGIDKEECLGFVSVDSRVPGVFIASEHAPLGKILANALFPILDLYTQLERAV